MGGVSLLVGVVPCQHVVGVVPFDRKKAALRGGFFIFRR